MKVFACIVAFIYQMQCGYITETVGELGVKPLKFRPLLDHRSQCRFPQILTVLLREDNSSYTLHLHINSDIDNALPIYSVGTEDIDVINPSADTRDFAAYLDQTFEAYFLAYCGECQESLLEVEGVLYMERKRLILKKLPGNCGSTSEDMYSLTHVPDGMTDYETVVDADRNISVEILKSEESHPSQTRKPRDVVDEYFIDVLTLVDHAIYQSFMRYSNNVPSVALGTIRRYFAHVMNGVDLRYKNIKGPEFAFHIRLVGCIVAQAQAASPWTEKTKTLRNGRQHVNADVVLEALRTWVNAVPNIPSHDHVMLFTGYDLFGEDSGFSSNYTTGLAFIGTMCQGEGRSVSVVEDHGGFQSVGTAAHELGHSLGAEHDGLNNTCTPADRYIMAGASRNETFANKFNPWRFSPCSIDYFKKYIDKVINNVKESSCLRSTLTPFGLPNIKGEMAGQLMGPDEQCRHIYGSTSYLCRGDNFGEATDVCRSMFCRNPKTNNKCVLHTAARGTSCGNKRWCVEGQCVGHIRAPRRPAGCPFGDQTGPVSGGKTCTQIVAEASGYCYVKDFRTRCCASCDSIARRVPGCEYGDRVLDCKQDYCGRSFKDGTLYDTDCCGTCNYAPPTTPRAPSLATTTSDRCTDQSEIDSITCSEYVSSAGKHTCYRIDVYNACCRTCEETKNVHFPGCVWGNRDPQECPKLTENASGRCSKDLISICCETCDELFKDANPTLSNLEITSPILFPLTAGSDSMRAASLGGVTVICIIYVSSLVGNELNSIL